MKTVSAETFVLIRLMGKTRRNRERLHFGREIARFVFKPRVS